MQSIIYWYQQYAAFRTFPPQNSKRMMLLYDCKKILFLQLGDCYPRFEAMHRCMGDNPNSFSKYANESQLAGNEEARASKPA